MLNPAHLLQRDEKDLDDELLMCNTLFKGFYYSAGV